MLEYEKGAANMRRRRVKNILVFCASLLAATICAAQEIPRFPISRFEVEGNTLLPQAQIDGLLAPFLGPQRDFGDIQRALEALEESYRSAGYSTVSVQLPEQTLNDGVVRFKVVEGRIAAIRFDGALHHDEQNLQATLPALRVGQPPRIDEISANLRVANENPSKKLTLRLTPLEKEGEIAAQVAVADEKPWRLSATLDNTGTRQTGRQRLGLAAQHANLWNRDHTLTYQYQTSPGHYGDVQVHALAYRLPLYAFGDSVDFYYLDSSVNAGTLTAGPLDLAVSGSGTVFGARYALNLPRAGAFEPQLQLGLDRKRFENRAVTGAIDLGNRVEAHPLLVQFNGRWQQGANDLSFLIGVTHNLPGGAEGGQAAFARVRADAAPRYTVWRAGLNFLHVFDNAWQIRLASASQWTRDALIPGEQFGIGGIASVRGFDERAVAADRGWQMSLELTTPELCDAAAGAQRCRALAFIDQGMVTRLKALPGEQRQESIASAGVGLRYAFGRHFALQADYGRVLQGGGDRVAGDWRMHFRVGLSY